MTKKKMATLPPFPNDHARDQFAALGMFVQTFETVVSILRGECSRIMRGGHFGLPSVDGKILLFHWNACALPFHHEAMHARAIADVWQALMSEQCQAMLQLTTLTERGNEIASDVVKEIASELRDLNDTRNRLLHATWRIGHSLPHDQDLTKINVEKYQVTKKGLKLREDLPKSFDELMALTRRVQMLTQRLGIFLQFFIYHPRNIEIVFSKIGDRWILTYPAAPIHEKKPSTSRKK